MIHSTRSKVVDYVEMGFNFSSQGTLHTVCSKCFMSLICVCSAEYHEHLARPKLQNEEFKDFWHRTTGRICHQLIRLPLSWKIGKCRHISWPWESYSFGLSFWLGLSKYSGMLACCSVSFCHIVGWLTDGLHSQLDLWVCPQWVFRQTSQPSARDKLEQKVDMQKLLCVVWLLWLHFQMSHRSVFGWIRKCVSLF